MDVWSHRDDVDGLPPPFRLRLKETKPALLLALLAALTLLTALALLAALTLLAALLLLLLLLLGLTLLLLALLLNLTRCHIILLTAILFWPGKS